MDMSTLVKYINTTNNIPSYQHTIFLNNFCFFLFFSIEMHELITHRILQCDDVIDVSHHKLKKRKNSKIDTILRCYYISNKSMISN